MNTPAKKPPRQISAALKSRHIHGFIETAVSFMRRNVVLCVALFFAAATSVIIPPDAKYSGYIDYKTIACLFCTLAVVGALKNIHFFTILARKIIAATGNLRAAVISLVCITFIGSMLIANDMALLTFLPLGYYVLTSAKREKYMAFTFIMQNIAANLGGMLTPFGNPQNLYLYSKFNISNGAFVSVMAPPFLISVTLIIITCLFLPRDKIECSGDTGETLPRGRTILYLLLFAAAIAIVFRAIPYIAGLLIITGILLIADGNAVKKVDYPLLLTFVAFFIFAGNMARIPAVSALFSALLEKNTLLFSVISCQFISNVPSAILLSQFTENWRELLVGVNIGGTGTLIASLASLITFREYTNKNRGGVKKYMLMFTAFNFAFLIILTAVESLLL